MTDDRVGAALRRVLNRVRVEYEVIGQSVTIVERRAPGHDDPSPEWTRIPIARLRFTGVPQLMGT